MPTRNSDLLRMNSDVELEEFRGGPTSISIVIPCFNEGEGVTQLADELDKFKTVFAQRLTIEFIFVDDGSSDDTWTQLNDHFQSWENTQLVQQEFNQGLSAAIMLGVELAKHEFVGSMDSDCTYHPRQFPELLQQMGEQVAMVTASPYHPEGEVRNVPEWRVNLSCFASRIYRLLFREKTVLLYVLFSRVQEELDQSRSTQVSRLRRHGRNDLEN